MAFPVRRRADCRQNSNVRREQQQFCCSRSKPAFLAVFAATPRLACFRDDHRQRRASQLLGRIESRANGGGPAVAGYALAPAVKWGCLRRPERRVAGGHPFTSRSPFALAPSSALAQALSTCRECRRGRRPQASNEFLRTAVGTSNGWSERIIEGKNSGYPQKYPHLVHTGLGVSPRLCTELSTGQVVPCDGRSLG